MTTHAPARLSASDPAGCFHAHAVPPLAQFQWGGRNFASSKGRVNPGPVIATQTWCWSIGELSRTDWLVLARRAADDPWWEVRLTGAGRVAWPDMVASQDLVTCQRREPDGGWSLLAKLPRTSRRAA